MAQAYDSNWINGASPDELTTMSRDALARIGQLPPDQKDRVIKTLQNDAKLASVFTQFQKQPTQA